MAINSQFSNLTVKNGYFKDIHEISWGLIQSTISSIKIENTTFANCTSNYATVINAMEDMSQFGEGPIYDGMS